MDLMDQDHENVADSRHFPVCFLGLWRQVDVVVGNKPKS